MPVEKSAGAIIFRKEDNKIYYLLLSYPSLTKAAVDELRSPRLWPRHKKSEALRISPPLANARVKDYWDLPKGHIEKGENEIETARREVEEETGLKDIEFVEGFKEWMKYFFKFKGKNILKFVTFYLAETKTKNVKISFEHLGYEWLPYEKALEQLTFKNAKEILKKAHRFLEKHNENTSY